MKDLPQDLVQYFNEVRKTTQMTVAEEATATPAELVERNLRFAIHIARRWCKNHQDLADRIQDANVGLIIAAHKFRPGTGAKFPTYAAWWIVNEIQQGISQTYGVMKPSRHARARTTRISKLRATGASAEEISKLISAENGYTVSPEAVQSILSHECVSVDENPDIVGDSELDIDWIHMISKALRVCNDKEQLILEKRLEGYTLDEVGVMIGNTREWVRQLEQQVIFKMMKKEEVV